MRIVHVVRQFFPAIGGSKGGVHKLAARPVAAGLYDNAYQREIMFARAGATTRSAIRPAEKNEYRVRDQLAYLINQYPKISHSFIRREIRALERRGVSIRRFAIRRSKDRRVVDPADLAEQEVTDYILGRAGVLLLWASFVLALSTPIRFCRAFWLTIGMMRGSDRSAILHLVYLLEASWLSRQLSREGIRHLHAHFGTNSAEVAMLSSELAGIPFSFTIHGPEEFDDTRGLHLAKKVERAAFVVAISSFGRSQIFRAVESSHWSKVKVVHCGVHEAFTAAAPTVAAGCRRLVCVGRLSEQKGHALLIAAAAELRESGLEFELVLVGDGELRGALEALIVEHGLCGTVSIAGWADESRVRQEIISARALVLPSFAEGLPVVVMEAMALGRPVIATYVGGIPELVVDGETGWLVPAGSEEALCGAIRDCLQSSDARIADMGAKGRARALDRHTVDEEALKLEQLFDRSLRCQGKSK
jgi:colanic acid/amylovoran biosynthesis glycosyltransferase